MYEQYVNIIFSEILRQLLFLCKIAHCFFNHIEHWYGCDTTETA